MSLVEVLFALILVMVVALGVMPLFSQAATSNLAGRESTQVSNFARSRLEELMQLPFNASPLLVSDGSERIHQEYYRESDDTWQPGGVTEAAAAGDVAPWLRTTTIRQYNISDLSTPLDSRAMPGEIHLREIEVTVEGTRPEHRMAGGRSITLRLYKSL
jgi:hypothetical protein